MTREEAKNVINELELYAEDLQYHSADEMKEALDMAIRAFEQQPCEDAISRQAAIDALDKLCDRCEYSKKQRYVMCGACHLGSAFDVIEELPSVSTEKTGRWIPVSEKLPEVNQRVLVTSYGRVCYAMMTSADGNSGYPIFRLQDSLNERVICETTVHSEFTTSRITAWMPLPEPYKAESEDNE